MVGWDRCSKTVLLIVFVLQKAVKVLIECKEDVPVSCHFI